MRALLLWLAILTCGDDSLAQESPRYVAPEFGNAYSLSAQPDGTLAVRIPVRVEPKVDVSTLAVTLLDVVVDARRDPALHTCITARLHAQDAAMPAIVIVGSCERRHPEAYEVTLGVGPKLQAKPPPPGAQADPAGPIEQTGGRASAAQKIAVKLNRPVPALRALASQSVDRVVYWPGSQPTLSPSSLVVSETSGRALPLTLSAKQVDTSTMESRPVPGRLDFTPATSDNTGHAELRLSVAEEFPLGRAKTTVEVRATDLAAPIYLPYEITTRLHPWMVLPAIVVGLVCGYLTRTVLKTIVERGTARIAALDLSDKMRQAMGRWKDSAFEETTRSLMSSLQEKTATADAASLKMAVTEADTAFAAALAEVRQRLSDLLRSVETTAALTASASQFPKAIAAALTSADAALAEARVQLTRGNIDKGRSVLETALAALARDVDAAAADWRTEIQNALLALDELPPLPPALASILKTASARVAEEIDTLPVGASKPDVSALLNGTHTIRFLVRHDIAGRVLALLAPIGARAIAFLDRADVSAAGSRAALETLQAGLQADVDTTLAAPAAAAADFLEALAGDIKAGAGDRNVDVAGDLAAGRYVDAARKVATAGQESGAVRPLTEASSSETTAVVLSVPPVLTPPQLVPAIVFAPHEPLAIARDRNFREIAAAKAMQFVIAAVGIAVVGLLVLLPTFDGTWRGILTAAIWGYAGDISVDALTESAKSLR